MRVLLTGAFGFVGTAVSRRLALAGHEVVAMTSRDSQSPRPRGSPVASVVYGDLRDRASLDRAVIGIDTVCHLAALTRVRDSFERPDEYFAVNAEGTRSLLAAMRDEAERSGVPPRIVLASTAAVYGAAERQPIGEDAEYAPGSPYAESKVQAELAVRGAVTDEGYGAAILRVFNASGAVDGRADQDLARLIPKALAVAAGAADVLEINGDGEAVRDYVHVDDVARAYTLAVGQCVPGRVRILNVGGVGASVADILAAIGRITGREPAVRRMPARPEPAISLADISLIRTMWGWKPERSSLDEIIGDAWRAAWESPEGSGGAAAVRP